MKMNDPDYLIDLQTNFEETRRLEAVKKYRNDLHKMRKELAGGYLSGTGAGRSVVVDVVKEVAPLLREYIDKPCPKGHLSESTVQAMLLSKLLGPEVVVGICIKAFLDILGREKDLTATRVIASAAQRLNMEWCRSRWTQLNPDAMSAIEKKYQRNGVWHKVNGTSVIMSLITNHSQSQLKRELPNLITIKAAGWALDRIARYTKWFTIETKQISKCKTQNFVKLSPQFETWYQKYNQRVEQDLMVMFPMLCPPRDWKADGTGGGYLNPVGRASHLQKITKGVGSTVAPKQLDFINNALQPTAWELNPFVVDVMEALNQHGTSVDSFKPIAFGPTSELLSQPMPDYIDALPVDHPERVNWRKERHLLHETANEARREGIRTSRNLTAAKAFKDSPTDKHWVPWSIGHNGRCYPLSAGALSPQGSDAERSMTRFADGAPMTPEAEHHLTLNVGNLYGINDSHQKKLDWVAANQEFIRQVATNPLDCIGEWEVADEPWQFLAACDEYYRCVVTRERTETKLPVYHDATASGLQILSLLSRDKRCAEKVNLVPGIESKQDIYASLKPLLREELEKVVEEHGNPDLLDLYIPRKAFKKNLVSRIYGSVLRSRKNAIKSTILECHNHQIGILKTGDAQLLAECMERAMLRLAPEALKLFDKLSSIGKQAASNGTTVSWITPVGNKVVINPRKHQTKVVKLGYFGALKIADDQSEELLDTRKVRTSTAPLLVHSLDASLLAEAFHDWDKPLSTAHDCVATRATDTSEALQRMLKAYVSVLKNNQDFLDSVASENGMDIDWQLTNTLTDEDVDNIIHCQYALC